MGCQYGDDRYAEWNHGIFTVLRTEAASLRSKGFRVVFLGDFNAWIGASEDYGIAGNHGEVNLFLPSLEKGIIAMSMVKPT